MQLVVSFFCILILASTILLGVGVGLLSKFFKFDFKKHILITLVYSFVIIGIINVLSPFYESVISLTINNFYFYIIMVLVVFIMGFITIYHWSKHKKYDNLLKVLLLVDFVPVSYSILIVSSASLSPRFIFDASNLVLNISSFDLGIVISILLMIFMLISYSFSDFVEDYLVTDYPIIFGSMVVIFAFVFMVFAFLIPNIENALINPSTELSIFSISSIAIVIVLILLGVSIGALLKKRNNRLK